MRHFVTEAKQKSQSVPVSVNMKELQFLGSLIVDPRLASVSTPHKKSFDELDSLLKKFYAKFKPSKCVCSDIMAEYYLEKLPLLSSRLLSTYGSDLSSFLDYNSKSKCKNCYTLLFCLLPVNRSALVI